MKSPIGPLVWALVSTLVGAAMFVGAAPGATDRAANCAGYCLYAPSAGGWSFDGQFHGRKNAQATKPWLRLSNVIDWKLALGPRLSGTGLTGEIHLGTPARPGKLLAVLCASCRSGSHGRLRLNDDALAAIFAGVPLGGGLPVNAYVVLHTSKETLRRQLRDS